MALLLSCQGLTKSFGSRVLFQGITAGIYDEERIGLIGPNGAGKSTFLKILAGLEHHDSGEITRRRELRVGYVAQEDIFPENSTPYSVLREALHHNHHMEEHDRETQIAIMLTKLSFENPAIATDALSGGWRKRLSIARELIKQPELLLLDEPTNHLDLEGIVWLERLLESMKFACVVVSHDRYLLENMTTRVVEINRSYPEGFYSVPGHYSDFLRRRAEFMDSQAAQQQTLEQRVRKEIAWLKRGPKAQRNKNKSRIVDAHKLMGDLSDIQARTEANAGVVSIEFNATERKTNKLLTAHHISKTMGDKPLFSKLDLTLTPGMKVGLLGPNGSGKTTLIKMLMGTLNPDSGTIKRARDLRMVLFDQTRQKVERHLMLREALSPQNNARSDHVLFRNELVHISSWAKKFLFRYEQLDLPVSALSGGEQARILVANLMLEPADVLILDEPTNDLDIPSLEVLEESLDDFPGALVLVTHDRAMLDRLSTELLALDGEGNAQTFGDFAQWENAQDARKQARREQAAAAQSAASSANERTASTKARDPRKRLSLPEQKEWDQIEAKIMEAEGEVERHQSEMDQALGDRKKLDLACQELHSAQELVTKLYARWEELEQKRQA